MAILAEAERGAGQFMPADSYTYVYLFVSCCCRSYALQSVLAVLAKAIVALIFTTNHLVGEVCDANSVLESPHVEFILRP